MRIAAVLGILVSVTATCGPPAFAGQETPRLFPAEAKNHRGEVATVCGVVTTYSCSDQGTEFNLDGRRESSPLRVLVPKANRRDFGWRLEDRLNERRVCAIGRIEAFETRSQIVAMTTGMLVLDADQNPQPLFAPAAYVPICDQDVTLPKLKRRGQTDYPAGAVGSGIYGTVALRGVVEPNGRVGEVRVVRSLQLPDFDAEAVRAVKRFMFDPGRRSGQPVPVIVAFEIEFKP